MTPQELAILKLQQQPGVRATGGGIVYDPTAPENQWEQRYAPGGSTYNARSTVPMHPGHARSLEALARMQLAPQVTQQVDPEVAALEAADDAFLAKLAASQQIDPETDDVILQENLERLGAPVEQFNQVVPQPKEDLERLAQRQVTPPPLDQTMYTRDYQEGLRRYNAMNPPSQPITAPSFNESLYSFLRSQGVNENRARYEVDRQEGLRRFKELQLRR